MGRIRQEPDGSFCWDCSIDREYHRKTGRQGLWAVLFLCAAVLALTLLVSGGRLLEDLWIPAVVIGVILAVSLPLLFMWNSAGDPHEQYVMTEEYVKSGYGKSAVYADFRKTDRVVVAETYLEMTGKYRECRIYVPAEDMDFVREFILRHLPEDAAVRYRQTPAENGR